MFDVIDSYGDVVRKGAFAKTISELTEAQPLGVYYAHNMNTSPFGLVGVVKSIQEDDTGLRVESDLLVDDNPEAKFLHLAMKLGVIREMSFAYYVTEGGFATHDGQDIYEIKNVDLLEVSVCPVGVNRQALVQEVKARLSQVRAARGLTKAGGVDVVEDEAAPGVKADDDGDAEATAVETLADVRTFLADALAAIDAFESASKAFTDPDQADTPADTDSKAAAEEIQEALALRVRTAKAKTAHLAGKEEA